MLTKSAAVAGFVLAVCLLGLGCSICLGAGKADIGEKAAWHDDWYDELAEGFDYTLRFLTYGVLQEPAGTSQNPQNAFLQIPRYFGVLALRPDLYQNFKRLELSVKPRMNLDWAAWEDGIRDGETEFKDDFFINQWLARISITDTLFLSYGRENLQWGPSFLLSPSNPFFRDNGHRNPKQEVAGMDFARLVWLPDMAWTLSLIANTDQGRQEFLLQDFEKSYSAKLDYAGQEGYAGLILSHNENDHNFVGVFGGRTVTDAFLLYGEGNLSQNFTGLYPTAADNPLGADMRSVDHRSSPVRGIGLLGGSYTLSSGPTLTAEYVYNGRGYNADQADKYYLLRKKAANAFHSAGRSADQIHNLSQSILARTMDPGLRLLRQNYLLLQYRHHDIRDVLDITLRQTWNGDDGSGQFIGMIEYYLGDHIQLFSILNANSGGPDTEFGSILDYQWMVGLEFTF